MISEKQSRWTIFNNLKKKSLEISQFKPGTTRSYESISPGQSRSYYSIGKEGRIALRIPGTEGFRVNFGTNDFPGWFEVDSDIQPFNTILFPNGEESNNGNEFIEKTVTVAEPE